MAEVLNQDHLPNVPVNEDDEIVPMDDKITKQEEVPLFFLRRISLDVLQHL